MKIAVAVPVAAEMLGISRAHAYKLVHDGKIPSLRLGSRRFLVPLIAVEMLLSHRHNQTEVI